ncbi:MAG: hypothetical protein ACKOWX_04220 [Flavobacteriales bacterium]
MKLIVVLFLSLFCVAGQAQGVFRGNVLVNAYTGYPNFLKINLNISESIPANGAANFTGLAPSGLRLMYMVSDDVSVGIDLMYGMASVRYNKTDTLFYNGQWNFETNTYFVQKQRFRPQFRLDMHLGAQDPNLDQYIGLAVGGNMRTRKVYQNEVLVDSSPNDLDFVIPVSFRVCYGLRYFTTYNFALGGEVGLGGPLLQFALSYRL